MNYSFDIEHAKEYGVDEAIMVYNLQFWLLKNKASGKNFHDNHTWTFNSAEAFTILFPFWSPKQIRRILKSLESQGVLITGNYNKSKYDKTLWYAFKDENKFLTLCPNGKTEKTERENRKDQTGKPIPDSIPDSKPDSKPDIKEKFTPPTEKEIIDHCLKENLNVDAFKFIKHYEAADWKIKGGTKMKNWKQALVRWHVPTPEQERQQKRQPDSEVDKLYPKTSRYRDE